MEAKDLLWVRLDAEMWSWSELDFKTNKALFFNSVYVYFAVVAYRHNAYDRDCDRGNPDYDHDTHDLDDAVSGHRDHNYGDADVPQSGNLRADATGRFGNPCDHDDLDAHIAVHIGRGDHFAGHCIREPVG